jgi:hypothetical protein
MWWWYYLRHRIADVERGLQTEFIGYSFFVLILFIFSMQSGVRFHFLYYECAGVVSAQHNARMIGEVTFCYIL